MFAEDELIAISALQHFIYCPRRSALIHLEQTWGDNVFTAEGTSLHERTHQIGAESRDDMLTARSLRLHSFRLGLVGVADVVEFHRHEAGIRLPGRDGLWRPYPVEYKRGIMKNKIEYRIQLCAQALCLEEMLQTQILNGAMYYGASRRRAEVEFDEKLRRQTEQAADDLHQLFKSDRTPQARYQKKCDSCSLFRCCMPKTTGVAKKIDLYLAKAYEPPPEMTEP